MKKFILMTALILSSATFAECDLEDLKAKATKEDIQVKVNGEYIDMIRTDVKANYSEDKLSLVEELEGIYGYTKITATKLTVVDVDSDCNLVYSTWFSRLVK